MSCRIWEEERGESKKFKKITITNGCTPVHQTYSRKNYLVFRLSSIVFFRLKKARDPTLPKKARDPVMYSSLNKHETPNTYSSLNKHETPNTYSSLKKHETPDTYSSLKLNKVLLHTLCNKTLFRCYKTLFNFMCISKLNILDWH